MSKALEDAIEALKPFADEAEAWSEYSDEEALVEPFGDVDSKITVGDLRRAKAAILSLKQMAEG